MKLLIISGFLGSGKTALLLRIAKRLASASRSIAIIENERERRRGARRGVQQAVPWQSLLG
jgi:G3E family GTPase